MIISRTPLRISFAGGGTDICDYYKERGGAVVSAAINKYIYITVNKNAIPGDPEKPSVTSGIRVGTPAVTTRGLNEDDMKILAHLISLTATDFDEKADYIRAEVTKLCEKYPLYE